MLLAGRYHVRARATGSNPLLLSMLSREGAENKQEGVKTRVRESTGWTFCSEVLGERAGNVREKLDEHDEANNGMKFVRLAEGTSLASST